MLAIETETVLSYFHATATFCSALVTSEFWEFKAITEFSIEGHLISAHTFSNTSHTFFKISQAEGEI